MKYFLLIIIFSFNLFSSELININFKDLSIPELINITSKKIGKSILVTEKIDGKVDFISNSAIEKDKLLDILKYSLKSKGYKLISNGAILNIVKKDFSETKKQNKRIINFKKKVVLKSSSNNNLFINDVVFLENANAKTIGNILDKIVSKRKFDKNKKPIIAIDEELNSIIISATLKELNNIKNLIAKLDRVNEQVYIKAVIVELDNDLIQDIGIKYGILGGKSYSGGLYTFSSSLNGGTGISIDTQSIGLTIPNVTSTLALGASLSLLKKTYGLDIISEPSILCINNKQSSIYVGETISIQTGTTITDGGNTSNTYEREDIGLTLKVKPKVSKEKRVNLEITTLVEDIKNRDISNINPDTTKKEIKTQAILNNGESVIIGGLIEKKSEKSVQKIPFAGDIPLIGELFKNRTSNAKNKNLVVIITPYIVPKNRDLTYVREELSKLKSLEDQFLEKVLIRLREKKLKKEIPANGNLTKKSLHQKIVNEYFGI